MLSNRILALTLPLLLVACATPEADAPKAFASIDGTRIAGADSEPGNWLAHGRTYGEQRFSPLDEINADNVGDLGLAWTWDTGEERGHEASPIVVDDTLFVTSSWSIVHALDARTGQLKWTYDPEVPREHARWACCDVVNRGVAVWKGRVFVGTIDGRLVALDAATGVPAWDVLTVDPELPYTITGAPRIVKDKVIIGNGGAEYGVRGYVTAYDTETGDQAWRFWTVPGDPSLPVENAALMAALPTWTGEWWKVGGGGTVWDSMAYDPDLDLLYIGVGNGSPWTRVHRSPDGGDNLYLSSIVALRPDTGEYVWHYQTTPGDNWDYTATQHIIVADLAIDGTPRKVVMQAPKNGFFYVLDAATGELVSAENYATMTWASGVDPETGRPVETGIGTYASEGSFVLPGPAGGHNWHPMSFSPQTGLVYIPAIETGFFYGLDDDWVLDRGKWNTGVDFAKIPGYVAAHGIPSAVGYLRAWDPVAQKEVWNLQHPGVVNGGVLSTAGNLVFQGTGDGRFLAIRADTGEVVFDEQLFLGIIAPPITYTVDGVQHVAVLAGWGGIGVTGNDAGVAAANFWENRGRLFVFKLGGTAEVPPVRERSGRLNVPERQVSVASFGKGEVLFHQMCAVCHGILAVSSGATPDLRMLSNATHERFVEITFDGTLHEFGMDGFSDVLDKDDIDAIHDYVSERARQDAAAAAAAPAAGGS